MFDDLPCEELSDATAYALGLLKPP